MLKLMLGLTLLAQQPPPEPLAVIVYAKGAVQLTRAGKTTPVRSFDGSDKYSWVLLFRGDRVRCGSTGQAIVFDGRVPPAGQRVKVDAGKTMILTGDASRLPERARRRLAGIGKTFGASMGGGSGWILPLDRTPVQGDGLVFRTSTVPADWQSIRVLDPATGAVVATEVLSHEARKAMAGRGGHRLRVPRVQPGSELVVSILGAAGELLRRRVEWVGGEAVPTDEAELRALLRATTNLEAGADLLEVLGALYEGGRLSEMLDLLIRCAWLEPKNEFWRTRAHDLADSVGVSDAALDALLPQKA
ncbi:MAG: hypothetical protein M9921_05580 [Fimbriimonadaceae bacterium]|nr:hypothetical protein [Fimbriimonadaceae bacterium]